MKIQYISDIHTEFYHPVLEIPTLANKVVNAIPEADVLILAGDIGAYYKFDNLEVFLDIVTLRYKYVLYVKGNHEYYDNFKSYSNMLEIEQAYINLQNKYKNLYLLDNDHIVLDGKLFVGTTLWFDVDNPEAILRKEYMNDYHYISEGEDYIRQQMIKANLFMHSLANELPQIDIFISHHGVAPVFHEKFRGSVNNVFFYRDISKYIEELDIKYIIQGHQHWNHTYALPCNVNVDSERRVPVLMNCKGYPKEGVPDFDYGKFIEL